MEGTRVEARDVTVLRMAIFEAERCDYDGPGKNWHCWPDENLAEVIARGEHLPVLRSPEFARKFWHLKLTGGTMTQPRDLITNRITADLDRWKEHHTAIQNVDPLEYLDPFIH